MKLLIMVALFAAGCTENSRSRGWGGKGRTDIACGHKVFDITWKGNDLWVATVPMQPGDKPRLITFGEDSSWGMMNGQVTIQETVCGKRSAHRPSGTGSQLKDRWIQ